MKALLEIVKLQNDVITESPSACAMPELPAVMGGNAPNECVGTTVE